MGGDGVVVSVGTSKSVIFDWCESLTFRAPITTAADDILKYIYILFIFFKENKS